MKLFLKNFRLLEKTTSIKVISEENFKVISHDFLPRTIFGY